MPRFTKGTNDHDGDGRKGGSRKGGDMSKSPAKTKAARAKAAAAKEETAALQAEAITMATVPDPQSGGVGIISDEVPSVKEVRAAKKAALDEQFSTADAEGSPDAEAIVDASLSRAMRGY